MDGHGNMNMRNYYCYEPAMALNGDHHLGLQLMPTTAEKPLLGGRNHSSLMMATNGVAYRHPVGFSGSELPIDYMRKAWNASNERYFGALHGNHHYHHHHHHSNYLMFAEASTSQPMQVIPQPESAKDETVLQVEERDPEVDQGGSVVPTKKRSASKTPKSPKAKKPTRAPRAPRDESTPSVRRERLPKRSTEVVVDGLGRDISGIPIPVCSCTGTPQQCYRWGSGGWQSACCTTGMSMYPLPMSTKRRGARIAGRKMSCGAFRKVLERLISEGYNFTIPIDLRTYWAKHGTNKFVTIR